MKARSILTGATLFAVALFILDAPAAVADTKYFRPSGTTANWSDDEVGDGTSVWYDAETGGSQTTRPVDGDIAVILAGKHCDVDINNARADQYAVRATAELSIDANCLLEIDTSSGGYLILEGSGSTLKISASLWLSGPAKITGQDPNAVIEIGNSLTLTLGRYSTIEGTLKISGASGTLKNLGVVTANAPPNGGTGTLEIATNPLDTDLGVSGEWVVSSDSSNVLKFSVGSTSLGGLFTVWKGTLDIDQNICTTGNLLQFGGTIDVAPGKYFKAGCASCP